MIDAPVRPKIAAIAAHTPVDQQGDIDMKPINFAAAALACLLTASPALAGGDDGTGPFEPFVPEPIIADCWQRSDELRSSGYIEYYGDGLDITLACMKAGVLEQIDAWLLPEFSENAAAHLDALEDLHDQLYYRIYAENRYCTRSCGLLPSMVYIENYIEFLEKVLRDIAEEKNYRYRQVYGPSPHNGEPAATDP